MKKNVLAGVLLVLSVVTAAPLWADDKPKELAWQDMIPPDAPPEIPQMTPLHDLSKIGTMDIEAAPAAKQSLPDAPVVTALNGQHVRLPGYIVPLEVSEEGRTTEFLLVPYFGACIHVPPPPSNQIVHVTSELGVKVDELYQPYGSRATCRSSRAPATWRMRGTAWRRRRSTCTSCPSKTRGSWVFSRTSSRASLLLQDWRQTNIV